jgi:excinuclease ABC subunit A
VPNLERRYRETESATVREELAKFLSTQPCPDCRGTRLRREARHVGRREDPAGGDQPADRRCLHYFGDLTLTGRRGEIADKILKEIRERLQFLVNVGLDYLSLDRSADTLSGGEPSDPPGQPDRRRPGGRHVHPRRTVHRPAPARQRPPAGTLKHLRDSATR